MRFTTTVCGVAVAVAVILGGSVERPAAQGGLIVNTSFDCPEWNQGMGTDPCPQDNTVGPGGGWTGSSGRLDAITLAANNPLGTGRGFRHMRDPGTNSNGGGIQISFPATNQLWMRVYMRYSSGFSWANGQPHYTKDIYWNVGTSSFRILGFYGNSLYVHVGAGSQNVLSSDTWSAINGSTVADGQFHAYEQYIKVDTNGSNGELKLWRDGVLVLNRTGLNLGGGSLSFFLLGSNQSSVASSGSYTDYDDLAISTTGYIGPLGGTPPPAPVAPVNLRITTS